LSLRLVRALAEVSDPVAEVGLTPRVCIFTFGPWDIVTSDLDFDTEENRRKFWNDIDGSQPAYAEWRKKRPDLADSEHHRELLQVP
jgi:hypothetical protein